MNETNQAKERDELGKLKDILYDATVEKFGSWSGAYRQPQYLVALPGDARQNVVIAGHGSPEEERRKEVEPIHGDVQYDGDLLTEWWEPVIGLGLSYNRDFRWAYICDKPVDEISPEDVHIEQITGTNAVPEVVCAHPDAEIYDLNNGRTAMGEPIY